MAEKIGRKKRNSEMRGQSANEQKQEENLADTGWTPDGGVSYERSESLQRNHVRRGLGPAGEATYESTARRFPAWLYEELISLIYTRSGPMSCPRGPYTSGESKSESPPLTPAPLRYKN